MPLHRIFVLALVSAIMVGTLITCGAGTQPGALPARAHPDSLGSPSFIASLLVYQRKYDFLQYGQNHFQWRDPQAMTGLQEGIRRSPYRKMRVVHIGDSHVQADMHPGMLRNRLQSLLGEGGRGMVFPYSAAGTHPGYDYFTRHWGTWKGARNVNPNPQLPLGVAGVSIATEDALAGFSLRFNSYYRAGNNRKIRLFCDCDSASFTLQVRHNTHTTPQDVQFVRCPPAGFQGFLEITLAEPVNYLQIDMLREADIQNHFELYGISVENPEDSGILYHSVGINGAGFSDVMKEARLPQDLRLLRPDVVFLDLGGNEFYSNGLNAEAFEARLRDVVTRVRSAAPQATVVVGCSQDINRFRVRTVAECRPAAELARAVALELGCAFYDYYAVAGGYGSMNKWYAHQLAKYDRVHLSFEGYSLKSELFGNAILNTYHQLLLGRNTSAQILAEHLAPPRFIHIAPHRAAAPVVASNVAPRPATPAPVGSSRISHTVRSGDVLGSIAQRYGVTVGQLQAWNGLHGTLIQVGQQLVVFTNGQGAVAATPVPRPAAPAPQPRAQRPPARNAATCHTIRSGDTLWGIANTHNTTVEEICRLNGIARNATLRIGQQIKLR